MEKEKLRMVEKELREDILKIIKNKKDLIKNNTDCKILRVTVSQIRPTHSDQELSLGFLDIVNFD